MIRRATLTAISRAARLAGAESFILSLASGFGTPISERGLTLSAGQRQRIALARAFLRDAPLVLLDEPTAHLDPATASQIMATLQTLMAGRTVVLISHSERPPGMGRPGAAPESRPAVRRSPACASGPARLSPELAGPLPLSPAATT